MRLRRAIAVIGLAVVGAALPVSAAGAATVASAGPVQHVSISSTCAQLEQQIADLEARVLELQFRLRHAATQDKPRIIRQIVATQDRIGELQAQLETCV
jgi:hypothetical protein